MTSSLFLLQMAYMLSIMLLILLLKDSTSAEEDPSLPTVDFYSRGNIVLADSHWLLSLVIDLGPYRETLDTLSRDLRGFRATLDTQMAPFVTSHVSNTSSIHEVASGVYDVLHKELNRFESEVVLLQQLYRDVCMLFLNSKAGFRVKGGRGSKRRGSQNSRRGSSEEESDNEGRSDSDNEENFFDLELGTRGATTHRETLTRSKRGILGFLGPLFSAMFDLPSERDFTIMRTNVESMFRDTKELRNSMLTTLHVLNSTREEVSINRDFLNQLSHTVLQTRTEIFSLLSDIHLEVESNLHFSAIIDKINGYFNLAASNLRISMHQLTLLKSDLMMARYGQLSPTLIGSNQFLAILKNIRERLSRDVSLPFKLRDVGLFYDLPVILTRDKGHTLSIIMDIPLKSADNQYSVYEPIQTPVVIDGIKHIFNLDKTDFLAISENQKYYMKLNNQELALCQTAICKLNHVKYSSLYGRDCIYVLYARKFDEVSRVCNLNSSPLSDRMEINWVHSNLWEIVGAVGVTIDIACAPNSGLAPRRQYTISRPVEMMEIPSECYLESNAFQTPKYINNYLNVTLHKKVFFDSNFSSDFFKDKSQARQLPTLETFTLPIAPDVPEIIDVNILPDADHIIPMSHKSIWLPSIVMFAALILGVIACVVMWNFRRGIVKRFRKRHSQNNCDQSNKIGVTENLSQRDVVEETFVNIY